MENTEDIHQDTSSTEINSQTSQKEERHPVIVETARFPEEDKDIHAHAHQTTAHTSVCDRRLSRAARALLYRPLSALFPNDDNPSVWKLLEDSLAPSAYQNGLCPLIPSRDLLRHHEENAIILKPPPKKTNARLGLSTKNALYTITKRNWIATSMYQCGICGKLFTSRYYLDHHLDENHSHEVVETLNHGNSPPPDNLLCPADWCHALPFCAQKALELEPFYGPGSNGLSPHDRFQVQRDLWNSENLEGCDEETMKESQQQCYELLRHCFDENTRVRQYLEHTLCESINCPDRLHQLFFSATLRSDEAFTQMRKQVHEWQDVWDEYYSEHHALGWMGTFLLVALVIGYGRYAWKVIAGSPAKALQKKDPKGSRLLQRKTATVSSSLWRSAKRTLGITNNGKKKDKDKSN